MVTHPSLSTGLSATSVNRPIIPLAPTGTKPDGQRREPRRGRYTVVSANGHEYLYVPEIQELFRVTNDLAQILRSSEIDPVKIAAGAPLPASSQAAYSFVELLLDDNRREALSEKRWQHQGLRDVVLHVSQVCNLNCVYCYAVELNKANKFMTVETAAQVVDRTMDLAVDGLASVKFLGGEPTLAWPVIEYLMDAYTAASQRRGVQPPRYTTVTNGTKMTPAMIASAGRHEMYVLVSVDGPQEIHDQLRPHRGGAGSYYKATATLRAMIDAGVNVAVESVFTRQHFEAGITPQMMIDHFLSLGVREFQIAPAVGVWHESDTIDQMKQVAELFVDAARGSIRSHRTPHPYLLRGIQFVLDGFALRERRRHVCGAGRTFMGINYDGEAFPCYLLESPDTSYGLIGASWDQQRYESIRRRFVQNGKEYHPVCRECWANEICQSCLGTSWQISPEITKPPAWFCQFQKMLIGAVLAEIAESRESDDWHTFLANMDRHLSPIRETADCS
jgi:uncharacterized protein